MSVCLALILPLLLVPHTLRRATCRVFKYVPYGRVEKVVPYLLRRANEAQYASQGGKADLALVQRELWRRITGTQHAAPLNSAAT